MRGYMCRFNFALSMCLMTSQPPLCSRYKARLFIYLYSCNNLYHTLAFFFFFFFFFPNQYMNIHSQYPTLRAHFHLSLSLTLAMGKPTSRSTSFI
ncbi:hypothetical protein Tsubulata_038538 [Turnera subulata]|uniref:Uncharacterized protein n=1 Tax=Turnera subulata TaxID=218843 RepID=A0A9Q0G848_9ROSI|nr:hypothetical protein Tsubulata_038538 [Turnera subulata]